MTETKKTTPSNVTKTSEQVTKPTIKKPEAIKPSDNFAIIKTGGKQYLVEAGRFYEFEKLDVDEGATLDFQEVLLVVDGDNVKVGKPFVEGAKVIGKVLAQFKDDKVLVLKYKKRKRIHKSYGHRQSKTRVEITSIK